ncbi:MAG: hypothetical protein KDB23_09810 [Planctomycetales bacterium]|nr:hypothetical protein [Planctomycetales bacterium]
MSEKYRLGNAVGKLGYFGLKRFRQDSMAPDRARSSEINPATGERIMV